jgi:isoquinoline 1-oxidoreductase alpha subunit
MAFTLNINGRTQTVDVPGEMPLLWVLRDRLDMKGTKFGCGVGSCRACTVHIDGAPTPSCMTQVSAAVGKRITTIEGVSANPVGQAVQRAWIDQDVVQCGYCQAGQIMAATALLQANPRPTDAQIDTAMSLNACRCATYTRIRAAIKVAAGMPAADTRES